MVIFFMRVVGGGIILGYIMAKICSTWLSKVFNDAIIETIITISIPYVTYFLGKCILLHYVEPFHRL